MRRNRKTTEQFIAEATETHQGKYDYSLVAYTKNKAKVKIICPDHGEFEQEASRHLRGSGCRECGKIKMGNSHRKTNTQFIEEAKAIHGDRYDYSLVDYKHVKKEVKIICRIHGEFLQTRMTHILLKHGCQKCGIIKNGNSHRKETEQFIKESIEIHGEKYDYSLVDYKHVFTNVVIICPDHGKFEQRPTSHLQGSGCYDCGIKNAYEKKVKSLEQFIIDAREVHGDKYDYSLVEYVNRITYVKIICSDHGEFEQAPSNHLRGHGCQKCNHSKGATAVEKYLVEMGVEFENEKKFDDCKNEKHLPFDFYVGKIKLLIEFDGRQHYEPVEAWGGEEEFKKQQLRDGIKNQYAKKNGYYLVRIRYIDNIPSVLGPYIELYNLDEDGWFVHENELIYDDLDL